MVDKRLHILETAEQLFAEKGFDGTSVRDIASRAHVNLAMISYYFGSKEKLFNALIEWRADATHNVLNELAFDDTLKPFQKMEKLVNLYVDKITSNSRFHCIMTTHLPTIQSENIRNQMTEVKYRTMESIRKIITEGQHKGVFRKVDIELTVASIMGTIIHVTSSRPLYYKVYGIEEKDPQTYSMMMAPKLKTHLFQLLQAHLCVAGVSSASSEEPKPPAF